MKKKAPEKKFAVQAPATSADSKNLQPLEVDLKEQLSMRMRHLFGEETLRVSKLPTMTGDKPMQITESERDEIFVLNAKMIGARTSEDEDTDFIRNFLRLAQIAKFRCGLITGDVIYMVNKKSGNQRPYHTQVSGMVIDPKKVQDGYPKGVSEDPEFEPVEKRLAKGHAVFMTLKMRLDHILDMIEKAFKDDNGKPLFSGPLYITFGKLEDELVMFYANELSRIEVFRTKTWAGRRIRELTAERKKKGLTTEEIEKIDSKIRDFREFWSIFAIMSNNADQSINMWRNMVTSYLIRKYEERIPNSKVISIGDSFVNSAGHMIMATTSKGKRAGKKLSALLAKKTESYTKGRIPRNIPEVMLGMGMNPCLDIKYVTFQASDEPGDKRMCMVIQLPTSNDSELYRDVIRNQNTTKDSITKVVQESGFESGVLSFRWCDCVALPIVSFWTSELLRNKEVFKDEESIRAMLAGRKKEHKIIYGHKEGCTHYGANDVVTYPSPNDPNLMLVKYHHQVAKEYLAACKAPILHHQHDGDITQQMNHSYEKNVHPEWLLDAELQNKFREIDKSNLPLPDKLRAVMALSIQQKIRGGVPDFDSQIEGYALSLEWYIKYFLDVLERSKEANLTFDGTFTVITHISGNHNKNTFKHLSFHVSDAKHIMTRVRELMLYNIIKYGRQALVELIRYQVTAPQIGPLGEARGSLLIDGRRCWAMLLKHKQGSMDKTQERGQRRGVEHNEVGLPICNLSGDDHRGGVRVTRGFVHIKTGCQQGEGPFGREIDFSEQNVFSMVYGLPVGGPSNGPLTFIVLDLRTMKRYAAKPFTVHRNELFKNALE